MSHILCHNISSFALIFRQQMLFCDELISACRAVFLQTSYVFKPLKKIVSEVNKICAAEYSRRAASPQPDTGHGNFDVTSRSSPSPPQSPIYHSRPTPPQQALQAKGMAALPSAVGAPRAVAGSPASSSPPRKEGMAATPSLSPPPSGGAGRKRGAEVLGHSPEAGGQAGVGGGRAASPLQTMLRDAAEIAVYGRQPRHKPQN